MGLRGTQLMGSIIYTLVSSPHDSTRIADSGWISDLQIFDLINTWLLQFFKSSTWSFDLSFIIMFLQGVLMNNPDNSDRSRGQLTAGIDTCHLLQIQSPWTWIWETGQTHSFAAFRTYKEWVPVVLRVPSASTRIFLRVVDTDTCQQSASMCVYRATQDGSWGLTFMICFKHGIQVLSRWRNSRIACHSLVWLFQCTKYSGYSTLSNKNSLPIGVMMIPEASLAFISVVFMKRHRRVHAQRSR
jgi:hypothetical protein